MQWQNINTTGLNIEIFNSSACASDQVQPYKHLYLERAQESWFRTTREPELELLLSPLSERKKIAPSRPSLRACRLYIEMANSRTLADLLDLKLFFNAHHIHLAVHQLGTYRKHTIFTASLGPKFDTFVHRN